MQRREIEECLEILWHLKENHKMDKDNFDSHDNEQFGLNAIRILERDGYINMVDKKIVLTDTGGRYAQEIVRRHRLAERLLADVLGMKPGDVEKGACEFEHILSPELTEGICILLGHPKVCPHGTKIPQGDCCRKGKESFNSLVMPLTRADIDEDCQVAYINSNDNSRIHRLFNFHIIPGSRIRVLQRYPSYVLQLGNTQLAMEERITSEIYVWRKDGRQN